MPPSSRGGAGMVKRTRAEPPTRPPSAKADCKKGARAIPLPLVTGSGQRPRPSRGRWRAATLLAVHLLVAAHIVHAALATRTLSPVEPSEAMYTLELGWLNAGALFLAVALLGT